MTGLVAVARTTLAALLLVGIATWVGATWWFVARDRRDVRDALNPEEPRKWVNR